MKMFHVLLQDPKPLKRSYIKQDALQNQEDAAGFGGALISHLQDILDGSTEETNYLVVCTCKNEITANGKVYRIYVFSLH